MWATHKQEPIIFILWVMWVIILILPIMPTTKGKELGTKSGSWGFVGHVGNLDSHFKSLAYNIPMKTIYKIQSLAIYPFIITHNTHKQAGSGSQAHSRLPTTIPTTSPKHFKTTHNMTRTRTLLQTVKELLADLQSSGIKSQEQ